MRTCDCPRRRIPGVPGHPSTDRYETVHAADCTVNGSRMGGVPVVEAVEALSKAALTPAPLLHPVTGEVLDLAALDEQGLVRQIHEVRRLQALLRELTDELAGEVLRRMDVDAKYSGQVGEFAVRGDGPGQVEYDAEGLRRALLPFVMDGVISQAAVDATVAEKTTLKVNANGVKALLKRGDAVSAAVAACGRPKKRRVTVSEAV